MRRGRGEELCSSTCWQKRASYTNNSISRGEGVGGGGEGRGGGSVVRSSKRVEAAEKKGRRQRLHIEVRGVAGRGQRKRREKLCQIERGERGGGGGGVHIRPSN